MMVANSHALTLYGFDVKQFELIAFSFDIRRRNMLI